MQHTYLASQIKVILDCESIIQQPDYQIYWLLTDSRKIIYAEQSLFFALAGKQDSHQYIKDLYQKGVRNFVISDAKYADQSYLSANFYIVDNTLKALQKLVAYHRSHFNYPVIGITGSNGKTIVKDWLYQILSPEFTIVRSPKSYNSQIGVPLSVWQMNHTYQLALIEAGISTINEMDALEDVIKPNIGILTNIKSAHDEGFQSREEKLHEKLKLFKNSEKIIYSTDYVPIGTIEASRSFTWSKSDVADLQILSIKNIDHHSLLTCYYKHQEFQIDCHFTDEASIENIIILVATLLSMNYSLANIQERIAQLQSIPMRLEMKQGINRSTLINDSYSADISSVLIAIDFLNQQKQDLKTLIVSDIVHAEKEPVYEILANYLEEHKINRVIGIGNEIKSKSSLFKMQKSFYANTEEFIADFKNIEFNNEGILIKGARKFGFERIAKLLEEKVHETVLEINLNAIVHNLNFYRSKLRPATKVMAMVKAFAYGSGSVEIASILQYNKVDYLAVAYADEGVSLRKAGINLPIMVMSPEPAAFDKIIEYNLEPELYNQRILASFYELIKSKNLHHYPIHIKLETGMNRLGFDDVDLETLFKYTSDESLKIVSVFSHLAASENEMHDDYTQEQLNRFDRLYAKLRLKFQKDFIRHISNTAGILRFPEAQYEMVRLGIGLYGIENVGHFQNELQMVGELKTTVTQIKKLKANDTVGYGRRGVINKDSEIATIKIGYADGYYRSFGYGNAYVSIKGQRAPVIGSVCMDMCMVDVTGLGVVEGDEVIIFGEDPSINDLAKIANTIPYEILTSISQRVQRIYYYE